MYICIVSLYIYIFIYILFHIVLFVFFIFLSSLLFVPMLSLAIYKHNSSLYMADTKMPRIVKKTVLLGQKERATHTLQKEWIQREEFWLFKRKKTHIFPRTSWAELSFKALFSLVFGVIFFFEILSIYFCLIEHHNAATFVPALRRVWEKNKQIKAHYLSNEI